jgi:predicted hotdog family 3-hydroxylacyl-ACP dehydratase
MSSPGHLKTEYRSAQHEGTPVNDAQTLNHEGIAALIPHSGTMCLLARLDRWDAQHIVCVATNHRDAQHPLRTRSGLLAPCAIEYAAQAMALHGALIGRAAGARATPGYLASARGVQLSVLRLDALPVIANVPDELRIEAARQAGDDRQILYAFTVSHAGRPIAEGRAAVVLNTALIA